MLAELKGSAPALNVEIVGINRLDQADNNPLVTNERRLPWLQDSVDVGQWSSWQAVWRDVRIVNSKSELASVYNLTANNLADQSNREALAQMLLDTAVVIDDDEDGLRDDWEALYLQELAATSGATDDPDRDGHTNFAEYAFGSHPRLATSVPLRTYADVTAADGTVYPALFFRRRAGFDVAYECRESVDLSNWFGGEAVLRSVPIQPSYDGTGTSIFAYASLIPSANRKQTYFQLQAQ